MTDLSRNTERESVTETDGNSRRDKRLAKSPRHYGAAAGGIAVAGLLTIVTATGLDVATTYIGLATCAVLGIVIHNAAEFHRTPSSTRLLDVPFHLSRDQAIFERYRDISQALLLISQRTDPIFREIALEQLTSLANETATVGDGTIVFEDTETWRLVYDKLLRSPGIHLYRSVSWMKTADYWQDQPGLQSMKLNFDLQDTRQINIERIVIINDQLWPAESELPVDRVHQWIAEQHSHDIAIQLVRESGLANEPDLIADIGIYGSRAVGVQELDEQCRTVRFTLTFDFDELTKAEDRWRRLSVYAMPYRDILSHFTLDGES